MSNQHSGEVYTKPKRVPKSRERPPPSALGAAAALLDHINELTGQHRIPAFAELESNESDKSDTHSFTVGKAR
jgi:hypothetical protein